jgi:hypothetical protein
MIAKTKIGTFTLAALLIVTGLLLDSSGAAISKHSTTCVHTQRGGNQIESNSKTNITYLSQVRRRASAPIVAITTPDPSTIHVIQTMYADKPVAQWDIVNGVRSIPS